MALTAVIVKLFVALLPSASVAVIVTANVPAMSGTPLMRPAVATSPFADGANATAYVSPVPFGSLKQLPLSVAS